MPDLGFTFNKSEHLKSRKIMDEVFTKGESIKSYPFLLKYRKVDFNVGAPIQIVISIPKRKIKLATGRNRIRRQVKEAYRLNKNELLDTVKNKNENLALFLIYTGKEKEEYQILESKIKLLLQDLIKKLT